MKLINITNELNLENVSHEELISLLNDLYSLRSKISHNALVIGSMDKGFSSSLIPIDISEEDDIRYFYKVCSYILINWLNTNFKEKTL